MNRSGIHDIPHQAGPKGSIQYCEAIPAMNKTKKNIIKGANEPLRYPGANSSEIINAKIIAAKIDRMFIFQTSEFIFFLYPKDKFPKGNCIKATFWELTYLFKQLDDKLLHICGKFLHISYNENCRVVHIHLHMRCKYPHIADIHRTKHLIGD